MFSFLDGFDLETLFIFERDFDLLGERLSDDSEDDNFSLNSSSRLIPSSSLSNSIIFKSNSWWKLVYKDKIQTNN